MKEKPNVNFNLSNQTYHRDKHTLSKPECTASYLGLFQTDFVMQFWFSLLRGATKIQEQVPSGSQKQRLPRGVKMSISPGSPLLWHIPALHSPLQLCSRAPLRAPSKLRAHPGSGANLLPALSHWAGAQLRTGTHGVLHPCGILGKNTTKWDLLTAEFPNNSFYLIPTGYYLY